MKKLSLFAFILLIPILGYSFPNNQNFDLVIYGATPSGIAAAYGAGPSGKKILIVEPTDHFGGLMTGGMSNPDFKTFEALSGFYREFMDRVILHYTETYGPDSQQLKDSYHGVWYEPKVAMSIFQNMLQEHGNIQILLRHELVSLSKTAGENREKLAGIRVRNGLSGGELEISGKAFIDASYEGDLMAMAGVPYVVGRESRSEYGELYAGVKFYDNGKFLQGSTGEGDHKIQCYNFRLCMTDHPTNKVDVSQPANYDREEFLHLLTFLQSGEVEKFNHGLVGINRIPNEKADINDLMYSLVSLRLPGENYEWPDGDMATRKRIFERHKSYTLAFLYFLQNDPEVPEKIREEASAWGFAKDEFEEYGHFPPILYVREARRMKGDFVLTERDLLPDSGSVRSPLHTDAIAICDYSMDSHGNAPPNSFHPKITEGVFNAFVVPYQIPYSVLLSPNIDGLLVTCAVSASHVAFSSLRMEPTWAALGQAGGLAAVLAIDNDQEFREIEVARLQTKLWQQKAMTVYISDGDLKDGDFIIYQFFGTRGYFHHLPEYADAPFIGRGKKGGLPGQFILKYPYHDLNLDKLMDRNLAVNWSKMAGIQWIDNQWESMNRTEFLIELYSKFDNHD